MPNVPPIVVLPVVSVDTVVAPDTVSGPTVAAPATLNVLPNVALLLAYTFAEVTAPPTVNVDDNVVDPAIVSTPPTVVLFVVYIAVGMTALSMLTPALY